MNEETGLPVIPEEISSVGSRGFFWRIKQIALSGHIEVQLRYKPYWWTPSAFVRKSVPLNTTHTSVIAQAAQAVIQAEVDFCKRNAFVGDYPPKRLA